MGGKCIQRFAIILQLVVFALVSSASSNTCSECSRDPDSCRRISGLYTVTVLTEGTYNPVVEIPFPACAINITEFRGSSNYIAVKTKSGQGVVNSFWALGQPGAYHGAGTKFTYERGSGSCKGTCIRAEGPTSEAIVVQILYYDKNPGIAYTFIVPNQVPFTPYDGVSSKQLPTASPGHAALGSEAPLPLRSRHNLTSLHHRRHRHRQLHANHTSVGDGEVFDGEYNTGYQSSRSEGRPEIISALTGQNSVRTSQQRPSSSYDYTGSRYGTHTLGGRGLSYTYGGDNGSVSHRRDQQERGAGHQIVDRVQPQNPYAIRKLPSPEYIAQPRQQNAPQHYQSFTATTSFLEENDVEQFDVNSNRFPPGHARSSGSNQYRWKISGFTECSHSCGGGSQNTNIICVSVGSRTQVVVTPENCADHLKPRSQTVQCNTSPCDPKWEAKDWSECSATCGSGTQTRIVECQQRFSPSLTLKVSADQCGHEDKPAIAQQCEAEQCAQWKTGPWSECNKECGGGEKQRDVRCVDKFEFQIPTNYCTEASPKSTERCNTQPCTSVWWISDWSKECSESCGQGKRSRTAVCMNNRGNVVSPSSCNKRDLPKLEESCRGSDGCSGIWFVGVWGRCSAECGNGVRVRQVVCLKKTQSTLSIARDEECDIKQKPKTEEGCVSTACNARWYTSPWSECSVTCGEGRRTREIRCIEDNKRPSANCVESFRPKAQEICSETPCPYRQQLQKPVRSGNRNNKDSQQPLEIRQEEHFNEELESFLESGDELQRKSPHRSSDKLPVITITTRKQDKSCKDSYRNCRMVTQARLCSYIYYQKLCCESCSKRN